MNLFYWVFVRIFLITATDSNKHWFYFYLSNRAFSLRHRLSTSRRKHWLNGKIYKQNVILPFVAHRLLFYLFSASLSHFFNNEPAIGEENWEREKFSERGKCWVSERKIVFCIDSKVHDKKIKFPLYDCNFISCWCCKPHKMITDDFPWNKTWIHN